MNLKVLTTVLSVLFLGCIFTLITSTNVAASSISPIFDNGIEANGEIQTLIAHFPLDDAVKGSLTRKDYVEYLKTHIDQAKTQLEQNGFNDVRCYAVAQSCAVTINASVENLTALSSIETVDYITENYEYELPSIKETNSQALQEALEEVQWGVDAINAPDVWTEYTQGQPNVILASMDTGFSMSSTQLIDSYAGFWYDPLYGSSTPKDASGHGTHTIGTMIGNDGIGVCPGCNFISIRICNVGCVTETIYDGANALTQYAIDHPEYRIVVNNSWGRSAGYTKYYNMDSVIETWKAVGIIVVFAAGNDGPYCYSSSYPANSLMDPYAIGSFQSDWNTSSFSARGWDAFGNISPDFVAPGSDILSTWINGELKVVSGTSMAAPHAVGAIGLLLSMNPNLSADDIRNLLFATTDAPMFGQTCDEWPNGEGNNTFGRGYLNIKTAADIVAGQTVLTGQVLNDQTLEPIENVSVQVTGPMSGTAHTDENGLYSLYLNSGEYVIKTSVYGYTNTINNVNVLFGQTTTYNILITKQPAYNLSGLLTDETGQISGGIVAVIEGPPESTSVVGIDGNYSLENLVDGTYTLEVTNPYCQMQTTATVDGTNTNLDIIIPDWASYGTETAELPFVTAQNGTPFGGCDDCYFSYELSQPIWYYGKNVYEIKINANGFIFMGNQDELPYYWAVTPIQMPAENTNGIIAPFWTDILLTKGGGAVWVDETEEGLIVEWEGNLDWYLSKPVNFSVLIGWDGEISMYYKQMSIVDDEFAIEVQGWNIDQYTMYQYGTGDNEPSEDTSLVWPQTLHSCAYVIQSVIYLPIVTR